jgi:hypothetical protein
VGFYVREGLGLCYHNDDPPPRHVEESHTPRWTTDQLVERLEDGEQEAERRGFMLGYLAGSSDRD